MENFANFNANWIKENGKRWEKDGKIRYYFNSILPVFDLLGIKYSCYKSGNFSKVDGYSNNAAWNLKVAFNGTYFDAVNGVFVGRSAIQGELEEALLA